MFKATMTAVLAGAILAASPGVSWADRDDRRRGWDDDDRRGYHAVRHDRRYRDHRRDHRHDHRRHDRRYDRHRYWNRYYWHGRRYDGWRRDWNSAYLGGALLGSAITYSIVHDHDHRRCDDRSHAHWRPGAGPTISGCYRLDRLPDGREVRVELPLSACR